MHKNVAHELRSKISKWHTAFARAFHRTHFYAAISSPARLNRCSGCEAQQSYRTSESSGDPSTEGSFHIYFDFAIVSKTNKLKWKNIDLTKENCVREYYGLRYKSEAASCEMQWTTTRTWSLHREYCVTIYADQLAALTWCLEAEPIGES